VRRFASRRSRPRATTPAAPPRTRTSSEDEIVLYKEIPVIEKRVVPAERVRIVKDVHADEAQISEKLRKERIDVETDAER
jgi:stress response protein YsnF